MADIAVGIPVVKQTFARRVFIPVIFKNVRRGVKLYNKSSIDKWGGQLKTTKREIQDFIILES